MATRAASPAKRWAREYETIYILRPDIENDAAEKIIDRLRDVIARLDGTLTKLDNWGRRRLAYPIRKNNRGLFVYLKYVGFSDLVAELERNLRLIDDVVRFQTVLVAEHVDPATVSVDPEEVQYLHVEDEEEQEDTETERARSLGLAPRAPRESAPQIEPGAEVTEERAFSKDESEGRADEEAHDEEPPREEARVEEAEAGEAHAEEESIEASSEDDERKEGET